MPPLLSYILEVPFKTGVMMDAELPIADDHLWGYFHPCSPMLRRFDFWRMDTVCAIGRDVDGNKMVLPNLKVSGKHATLRWDMKDGQCYVQDLRSTNGTYVDGIRILPNVPMPLRDGSEVFFGQREKDEEHPEADFRFIYCSPNPGESLTGLQAVYDLHEELGQGAYGRVFKATSKLSKHPVAIKTVLRVGRRHQNLEAPEPGMPLTPKQMQIEVHHSNSYAREISIMEKLDHPNIVKLKEVFWEGYEKVRSPYRCHLVLEYVDGGDLFKYVDRKGGLNELEAKGILWQMCQAMSFMHHRGVAHRDLKLENTLLTKDEPPVVKIADFGLAKVADKMSFLRTLCGTPFYYAPEIALPSTRGRPISDGPYTNLVDCWSVGVILFTIMTRRFPFDDHIAPCRGLIAYTEGRELERVSFKASTGIDVSDECQDFVNKLMASNPKERLSMKDALQHSFFQDYKPPSHHRIPDDYWDPETRIRRFQELFGDADGDSAMSDSREEGATEDDETEAGTESVSREGEGLLEVQKTRYLPGHYELTPPLCLEGDGEAEGAGIGERVRKRAEKLRELSTVYEEGEEGCEDADVEMESPRKKGRHSGPGARKADRKGARS